MIRKSTVYAANELLTKEGLIEAPIKNDIQGDTIELADLHEGLETGRWIIVSGERTDLPNQSTVRASEAAMIAGISHGTDESAFDDRRRTTLKLAKALSYRYKRSTAKLYGNVVKATHGETRREILGSGDGSKALQQFELRQPPLTYVAAPTPEGAQSTLHVFVNHVEWHEADSFAGKSRDDRIFVTKTDDDSKTAVIFGNGIQGCRLPTGVENVRSVYRNGIGEAGNVKAEQISLLKTRPLGVKEVINPLRASGGADRESRDQARKNAPLAAMSLDRLVSTQDYADFTRTFAGIGKASAVRLSDGQRQVVHLTIAGAADIPIDEQSDLYRGLREALRRFGDPHQPIFIQPRELMLIVLSARVRVQTDYRWESVEPRVRAALLETFGFERRELGQDVLLSEVISTVQQVSGVAYVDVDLLTAATETKLQEYVEKPDAPQSLIAFLQEDGATEGNGQPPPRIRVDKARSKVPEGFAPAQLALFSPDLPDTLILNEVRL